MYESCHHGFTTNGAFSWNAGVCDSEKIAASGELVTHEAGLSYYSVQRGSAEMRRNEHI